MTQIIVTLCYYCRYLGVTLEKRYWYLYEIDEQALLWVSGPVFLV
jgi:hypothetical protein